MPGRQPAHSEVWDHAREQLQALPDRYKALSGAPVYPMRFSERLQALRAEAMAAAGGDEREVLGGERPVPGSAHGEDERAP